VSEETSRVVRIERTFDAPPEDVFDAWTSEEVLRRWFHAGPDWDTPTASVDLRVGGAVRIVMRRPDGTEFGAEGEYTEIDKPRRLAMTWAFDDDPSNEQAIEIEFIEHDGRTRVLFTNSEVFPQERRDSQEHGWGLCFDELERVLGS
jgi:uncharacterized protein YndB with AHSA1/START domain